jgi:hypothetical protein
MVFLFISNEEVSVQYSIVHEKLMISFRKLKKKKRRTVGLTIVKREMLHVLKLLQIETY